MLLSLSEVVSSDDSLASNKYFGAHECNGVFFKLLHDVAFNHSTYMYFNLPTCLFLTIGICNNIITVKLFVPGMAFVDYPSH